MYLHKSMSKPKSQPIPGIYISHLDDNGDTTDSVMIRCQTIDYSIKFQLCHYTKSIILNEL